MLLMAILLVTSTASFGLTNNLSNVANKATTDVRTATNHAAGSQSTPKEITFEDGNFFAITQEFDQSLLDAFAEKVASYKGTTLPIYINSPGGSVAVLASMVRIMQGSDVKFVCVANFAFSAAFNFLQNCHERYVVADGILMSHNWAGSFEDEAPRILSLFNTIEAIVLPIDEQAAKNMGLTLAAYKTELNTNMWLPANVAVTRGAAQGIVAKLSCSKDTLAERKEITRVQCSFFGCQNRSYYISGCPFITKTYEKTVTKGDRDFYNSTTQTTETKTIFTETGDNLFDLAQSSYKNEAANLIYRGTKRR